MNYINLKNVDLDYPIYEPGFNSWRGQLKTLASAGSINRQNGRTVVSALRNFNLELNIGDKLGLIGGNGAGKTTLLKVLAGIYTPTRGQRIAEGRITTLLGAGFGLDEDATGYQNILLGGVALGFTIKEIKATIPDIEEFTELGDFLKLPLRSYSAGMRSRLAFAIVTCVKPNILLIDEGIGAGDTKFFEKAKKRLDTFLLQTNILALASHAPDLLRRFCNKGLYLHNGEIKYYGSLEEALLRYQKDIETKELITE